MNLEEAKKIIENEKLENYVMFSDGLNKPNKVVIQEAKNNWKVFTNDERAVVTAEKCYSSLSEALDDFIERLRGDKAYRDYLSR
ncbi:Imm59 family immunity protein [Virgibacillus proomii]|jgi:hypothetical protein|uniref:Imm59 family immunity protein n=1 Tax=Virgibacillus proomii TaxID=84407 RepID=UPI000987A19E|nr:Imm59 family immunity protein [Virgibacillus proomii]